MTDDDPGTATHVDRDGDLWRVTPSDAHLWSNHRHEWVEARTLLDLTHRVHGPAGLRRLTPAPRPTPHPTQERAQ